MHNVVVQLIQSLLMPAVDSREAVSAEFQSHFVQCEGLRLYLGILTDKNFMSHGDISLKR